MKKIILLSLLTLLFLASQLSAQLIITGAIDGPLPGGTPKAVEIYVTADVPDLSIFGVGSANNGGGSDGEEFTFPADAAVAGQFIYLASDTAQFNAFFGFDPDYRSDAMFINGDDAIELFRNGLVNDVFGDINVDGNGEPWEYLDGWAYRIDDTGPDDSTFVLASWTFSGPNALDGDSLNSNAATPFPIGTYTGVIPVELTSFSAFVSSDNIELKWNTATELNNSGFEIQKSVDSEKWNNIAFIKGNGTTTNPQNYSYVDNSISGSNVYFYRLKQIDHNGSFEYSKTIEVVVGTPVSYKLDQNYPNPFNPATAISFEISENGFVNLSIFNALGQKVESVVNTNLEAGYHQYNFNAANLTSGTYLYRLEVNNFVQIRKMLLIK